jgi:hypothetical protein
MDPCPAPAKEGRRPPPQPATDLPQQDHGPCQPPGGPHLAEREQVHPARTTTHTHAPTPAGEGGGASRFPPPTQGRSPLVFRLAQQRVDPAVVPRHGAQGSQVPRHGAHHAWHARHRLQAAAEGAMGWRRVQLIKGRSRTHTPPPPPALATHAQDEAQEVLVCGHRLGVRVARRGVKHPPHRRDSSQRSPVRHLPREQRARGCAGRAQSLPPTTPAAGLTLAGGRCVGVTAATSSSVYTACAIM